MHSCSAYLRVYEPLAAFPEEEGRRWAAYASSAGRPSRVQALAAEREDALRRLVALPPVAAPGRESADAYVRWAGGVIYICPWQTRLRSWLALARLGETWPPLLSAAFPAGHAEAAAGEFARWQSTGPAPRVHIQASTWSVPLEWFVPFAADERWLVLGTAADGAGGGGSRVPAARTLVYATAMAQARRRVAQALGSIRRAQGVPPAGTLVQAGPRRELTGLEEIGHWLEEFHPHALLELDYGGLVHLLDDESLQADESVADVTAAIDALAAREVELAMALRQRVTSRWRAVDALSVAS